jgi:hypothetical protein
MSNSTRLTSARETPDLLCEYDESEERFAEDPVDDGKAAALKTLEGRTIDEYLGGLRVIAEAIVNTHGDARQKQVAGRKRPLVSSSRRYEKVQTY